MRSIGRFATQQTVPNRQHGVVDIAYNLIVRRCAKRAFNNGEDFIRCVHVLLLYQVGFEPFIVVLRTEELILLSQHNSQDATAIRTKRITPQA